MRFVMIFKFEINWDEFLNLSMLYAHQRGDLNEVLQTGFIHLFHWLPYISENEADQVIAARILMFMAALLTSFALYKIARVFSSVNGALAAVVAYWSFGYVLQHAVGLRTDPMAACAMMSALWLIVAGPLTLGRISLVGLLIGLAGFFTIKAIFYLPVIVLIVLLRGLRDRSFLISLGHLAAVGLVALICFLGLITLHAQTFETTASPLAFLNRTTGATLGSADYTIRKYYGIYIILQNPLAIMLLVLGLGVALKRWWQKRDNYTLALAFAFLTPLLSLLFYSEAYPYFYAFILPPVLVFVAIAFDELSLRLSTATPPVIVLALLVTGGIAFTNSMRQPLASQHATLEVIHQLFPDGAPYIDSRSMVSSLPKHGIFMSSWGMTDYRNEARPVMHEILKQQRPQFLLSNSWHLDLVALTPQQSQAHPFGLLEEDFVTLRDNYVRFWGALYLPGKVIEPGDETLSILIPGTYRVEDGTDLQVHGQRYAAGSQINLSAGEHAIAARNKVTLILDLPRPEQAPSDRPLFFGF